MKRASLLIIALIILVIAAFIFISKNTVAKLSNNCPEIKRPPQIVDMKDGVFEPDTLNIVKCSKVVFKNLDNKAHWPASNLHPTHGIYPEFDPQQGIEPSSEWSFVFDKVGKWRYHDHLTPSIRGGITVNE